MTIYNRAADGPRGEDLLIQIYKHKSPAECVAIMGDANETVRILVAAGARYLHPDWSEEQIAAEVARRMLG